MGLEAPGSAEACGREHKLTDEGKCLGKDLQKGKEDLGIVYPFARIQRLGVKKKKIKTAKCVILCFQVTGAKRSNTGQGRMSGGRRGGQGAKPAEGSRVRRCDDDLLQAGPDSGPGTLEALSTRLLPLVLSPDRTDWFSLIFAENGGR